MLFFIINLIKCFDYTVGRNQLGEDKLSDKLRTKEVYDPFTGEAVVTKGKK